MSIIRIPRDTVIRKARSSVREAHELIFAIQQRNLPLLDKILLERSTPGNPKYQQWLSFEEIGNYVQNPISTRQIASWLQHEGKLSTNGTIFLKHICCDQE